MPFSGRNGNHDAVLVLKTTRTDAPLLQERSRLLGNSSTMFYGTPFCPIVDATEIESNQWPKYENECISYKNIHFPSLLKMEISDSLEPT